MTVIATVTVIVTVAVSLQSPQTYAFTSTVTITVTATDFHTQISNPYSFAFLEHLQMLTSNSESVLPTLIL